MAVAEPISEGRIAFAGEHCCKEHPDTVGGAIMTGLRAAVTVMEALEGQKDVNPIANWQEDEEERWAGSDAMPLSCTFAQSVVGRDACGGCG